MHRNTHWVAFEKVTSVVVSLFLFASIAACQGSTRAIERSADEQYIREAVLRKQMEDWIKGGDKAEAEAKDETDKAIARMLNFRIFFISVNDKDPSDDLITRFKDIPRVIKKLSASEISKAQRMPVVDRSSRQRGIIFSADEVRWLDKDSAEVEGGYHCDGLCGAGMKFRVNHENGKWTVKTSTMEWIS